MNNQFRPLKDLLCEVCNEEEAIGIANCGMAQAISHAYGANCINNYADPLRCVLAVNEILGGDIHPVLLDSVYTYKDGEYMTVRDAIARYGDEDA